MSKQIAQTVGDKRIGWLLAIIAAFLVLATLATQVQKSEALVTAADYDLTTPSTLCTGTVPVGTLCSYRIDIGPIIANSVGAVTFGAILDPHIGNITNIDTSGFTGVQMCGGIGRGGVRWRIRRCFGLRVSPATTRGEKEDEEQDRNEAVHPRPLSLGASVWHREIPCKPVWCGS